MLGSLLLPSYTIRPCLAGDKDRVYRKYAFKAEHRNTRSFYLAAESRPAMIQWMNALSLAAILQDSLANSTSVLLTFLVFFRYKDNNKPVSSSDRAAIKNGQHFVMNLTRMQQCSNSLTKK